MKIISRNVNGIRAVIKKGFLDFLKMEKPDILCLQEIKISDSAREKEEFNFPDYQEFWNSAERPGYSGTAILVRNTPPTPLKRGKIKRGKIKILPKLNWDNEGRIQILDVGKFYLVNVYFPNANHELSRLKFKIEFSNKLLRYLKKLEASTSSAQGKPIIITGDFNVAHKEIDLARPKDNVGNPGFTHEEREWMTKFLENGFVDTFRYFYPESREYTWWSYRFNARARNIGWRIDYFCVSDKIIKLIKKAYILDKIGGSDHCPIGLEIK